MWLKPQGYGVVTSPDAKDEFDTMTCGHCGRLTIVRAKQRPEDLGGFCTVCSGHICTHCVGKGCDVLEKKLQRMESLRSYGL